MKSFLPALLLLWLAFLLNGCSERVELHRQLSEQEANEVIAELADKHIRAQKVPAKDGVVVVVNAIDIGRAVRTLEAVGLPKIARTTLGDTFRKDGVISTPLEERARYIYALSQELEATLSNIDGVIVARVHVVLPERIAPGEPVQPASPVWQRLRLRFCFARVLELERSHRPYAGDASRLDTLWQAVVWRMTTRASTRLVPAPHAMDN